MNVRKICGLVMCSFLVVVVSSTFLRVQPSTGQQLILRADGTGPVPPLPPKELILVADGTGPVPPLPKPTFVADGTGPVPPLPPTELNFVADGTGPVPPLPPINAQLLVA